MSDPDNTIVVFGGNGYVGSRICEEGIKEGYKVISVSRSGKKPLWLSSKCEWANNVNWAKGDGSNISTYESYIKNIRGVVSCIGGFHYNQSIMEQINGDINVNVCKESKKNNVKRFVYISADRTIEFIGKYFINGYFKGKTKSEIAVSEIYGNNGVSFKAGAISGTRYIFNGWIPLPLYLPCMLFIY